MELWNVKNIARRCYGEYEWLKTCWVLSWLPDSQVENLSEGAVAQMLLKYKFRDMSRMGK